MADLDFLPNSPTLMNAGTEMGQLSACFVLPVADSMESIFEALKQMALVQSTGGGTGFAFSSLRPQGDVVGSTGGIASGPVSFMKIFDCATEHIKQGGKRRGANMGVLAVTHPDIMEFIDAKRAGDTLSNFNISVSVSDAFMHAAARKESYELIHPRTGRVAGRCRADVILEAIVSAAWQTGDPGLLFSDAINRANPTPGLGSLRATNPCGEVPLLPHESCNLGSINLARFVWDSPEGGRFDWQRLRAVVGDAVRFLDNVIEINRYPLAPIGQATLRTRKIGLGVMGFAEALIRLGLSYDSDEAVRFAERLMRDIADTARRASARLAEQRGSFPSWQGSVYGAARMPMRNATRTAIAPTGTIGIIAQTSASIEPLFALAYRRRGVLDGKTLEEVNPLFLEYVERHGYDADSMLGAVEAHGHLSAVPGVPEALRRLFVTALEIPPERHLAMQAAFQRHTDNSVSKTVNLPRSAESQVVAEAYRAAWAQNLKGITIYRFGSTPTQVIDLGLGESAHHYDHLSRCDPEECRL